MIDYDAIAEKAYEAYWESLGGECNVDRDKRASWRTMPAYLRRAWTAAVVKGIDLHLRAVLA